MFNILQLELLLACPISDNTKLMFRHHAPTFNGNKWDNPLYICGFYSFLHHLLSLKSFLPKLK